MTAPTDAPAGGTFDTGQPQPANHSRPPRRQVLAVGFAVAVTYVAVAVVVWWRVWTGHPTSELSCGCGDPALFVWSFGWVAHALAHGHNPFLSTAIFHPDGMNLLANTSAMLEAVLLAPVTWLFGPVAALNTANTLAPAVSAAATYWAVRRSLRLGRVGALVAGLVVELSPAVVGSSSVSHLQISVLAFVPVIGVCLHELLVRQEGSSWRWGLLLAVAAVGQFFVGTELLVIVALLAAGIVAVWAAHLLVGAVLGSPTAGRRARFALPGLVVGAAGAGLLLAGPAWYALAGPRSFSGPPWEDQGSGVALSWVVSNGGTAHGLDPLIHLAGYLGPVGAPVNYLGLAAVIAAVVAVLLLWRVPAVWALAGLAVASEWLALGAMWQPAGSSRPWWMPFLPWDVVRHLPVVGGVLAQNFAVVTILVVGALIGLLVDRIWHIGRGRVRAVGAALAVAVSAAVIGPLATSWALPLTVQSVEVPAWFVHEAPKLPTGSVVLTYPYVGPPGDSAAMVWQAVDRMHFAIAGGCCLVPGPNRTVDHGGTPGSATLTLGRLSSGLDGPLPALDDAAALASVRAALASWQVTTVVVVDRGRDPAYAVSWFTRLLGRPPLAQDGAQVWQI